MKISITDVKTFRESFEVAASVVRRSIVNPLYTHVRLTAIQATGEMFMDATDFDVYVRIPFQGGFDAGGAVLLPAREFKKFLKDSKGVTGLSIESGDTAHVVHVTGIDRAGQAVDITATFAAEDPTDFVNPADMERETPYVILPAHVWQSSMRQTRFAIAEKRDRYVLNGVLVRFNGAAKTVDVVGADGPRMALVRVPHSTMPDTMTAQAIIPRSGVDAMLRAAGGVSGVLAIGKRDVQFVSDGVIVTSVILEGQFPDYEAFLRNMTGDSRTATFFHSELRDALDHVKGAETVTLEFIAPDNVRTFAGRCYVTVESESGQKTTLEVQAEWTGESLIVTFVRNQLREWLHVTTPPKPKNKRERAAYRDPDVDLTFWNEKRPIRLSVDNGGSYQYWVMPVTFDPGTCPLCRGLVERNALTPFYPGVTRCLECAEAEAFSPLAPPHEPVGTMLRGIEGEVVAMPASDQGGVLEVPLSALQYPWNSQRPGVTCDVCGAKINRMDEIVPVWDNGENLYCMDCYFHNDRPGEVDEDPYDRYESDRAAANEWIGLPDNPPIIPTGAEFVDPIMPRKSWLARLAGAVSGALLTVYGS